MHRSCSFGGWLEVVGKIPGKQFVDSVDRMLGNANQDLTKIGFRVKTVHFG